VTVRRMFSQVGGTEGTGSGAGAGGGGGQEGEAAHGRAGLPA